jgi:uncharacterized protein YbaR (Trm112 family)
MRVAALDRFVCPLSRAPFRLAAFQEEGTVLSADEMARAAARPRSQKARAECEGGVLYCETSRK